MPHLTLCTTMWRGLISSLFDFSAAYTVDEWWQLVLDLTSDGRLAAAMNRVKSTHRAAN